MQAADTDLHAAWSLGRALTDLYGWTTRYLAPEDWAEVRIFTSPRARTLSPVWGGRRRLRGRQPEGGGVRWPYLQRRAETTNLLLCQKYKVCQQVMLVAVAP